MIHFYPNATQQAVNQLQERPWASVGLGFLVMVVLPSLIGFLSITIVGIPLAFILIALFLIYVFISRIFVMTWVGNGVFQKLGKAHSERSAFVAGLVLYSLLALIPFVGTLFMFLAILFGLGAALLMKKEIYVSAKQQGLI